MIKYKQMAHYITQTQKYVDVVYNPQGYCV